MVLHIPQSLRKSGAHLPLFPGIRGQMQKFQLTVIVIVVLHVIWDIVQQIFSNSSQKIITPNLDSQT